LEPVDAPFARKLIWRLEAAGYVFVSSLLRLLPVDAASAFGGWLLRTFGPLTSVNRTVEMNLRLVFPDMDAHERARIRRAQWDNLGRYFIEMMMMDKITPASGRVEVIGAERLKAIAEHGPPVVFVSGHLANGEIMSSAILASGVDCVITFRAFNNPYFNEAMIASRRRYGVRVFAAKGADGIREMLSALAQGRSIALMNDQKNNRGVAAPFFGHLAHTASGPTKLALGADTVLQPISVQRLGGARFRVVVHDPIKLERTGRRAADVEAGVREINAFVEARVRERPEEWFWVHKRWANSVYDALKREPAPQG
jgi:KDO2-lipid IV(A) lauroyltransferase